MSDTINALDNEINEKSKNIRVEKVTSTIGELIAMYERSEINITPPFQRLFRWNPEQKAKLIESFLLGIPVPPIFVSQQEDGVWDVIDGVQRLSTIMEFVGILKDPDGGIKPPSTLEGATNLPSLEGKLFKLATEEEEAGFSGDPNPPFLTKSQRLYLKRRGFDVIVVSRESDKSAKYELFMRLNTLGARLTEQEVRNCLAQMVNPRIAEWLSILANNDDFLGTLKISDRLSDGGFAQELVLRYIAFRYVPVEWHRKHPELQVLLNAFAQAFFEGSLDSNIDLDIEQDKFNFIFRLLNSTFGENCFRRFISETDSFKGPFSTVAFETIAIGLASALEEDPIFTSYTPETLREVVTRIWSDSDFIHLISQRGLRPLDRYPQSLTLGKRLWLSCRGV